MRDLVRLLRSQRGVKHAVCRVVDTEPFVVYVHEVWSESDQCAAFAQGDAAKLLLELGALSATSSVQTIELPSTWF